MKRILIGLAALVALVALLAGVPLLLLAVGQVPDPRTWSWEGFRRLWTTPDDGGVLIMVITIVAWLAWLVLAVSVIAEVAGVVSRRRLRIRLPLLGPVQHVAAVLVLAVAALVVAPLVGAVHAPAPGAVVGAGQDEPARTVRAHGAPAPASGRADADLHNADLHNADLHNADLHNADRDGPAGPGVTIRRTDARIKDPRPPATDQGTPRTLTYTVREGDDLWSLAERFYGDGMQWRAIAAANKGLLTGGPDELIVGWQLTIPGVSVDGPGAPATVTVRAGDTLSGLAARYLHDADRWPELYRANRDRLADPDQLPLGVVLRLPRATAHGDEPATTTGREKPRADKPGAHKPGADKPGADKPGADKPTDEQRGGGQPGDHHTGDQSGGQDEQTNPPATSGTEQPTQQPSAEPTQQPPPEPTQQPPPEPGAAGEQVADPSAVPAVLAEVAAVGALLATGIVTGLAARRQLQLLTRPLGRKIAPAPAEAQRVETALGRRADPLGADGLDLALRAIARGCELSDAPVPQLCLVRIGPERTELVLGESAEPPPGFSQTPDGWAFDRSGLDHFATLPGVADAPRLWPTLTTVGLADDGPVLVNLEAVGVLSIVTGRADEHAAHAEAMLTALTLELALGKASDEIRITAVGAPGTTAPDWLTALDLPGLTWTTDLPGTLSRMRVRAGAQRALSEGLEGAGSRGPTAHRLDPLTRDAWTPEVYVVTVPLRRDEASRLAAVIGAGAVSMAAVVVGAEPPSDSMVRLGDDGEAELRPYGLTVRPQSVGPGLRPALATLVSSASGDATVSAPWWDDADGPPPRRGRVDGAEPVTVEAALAPGASSVSSPDGPTALPRRALAPQSEATPPTSPEPPPKGAETHGGTITYLRPRRPGPHSERDPGGGLPVRPADGAPVLPVTPVEVADPDTSPDEPPPQHPLGAEGHPAVLLLGPMELVGATGQPPSRAKSQCVEYCAWILEHPGSSSAAMMDALCVAEPTRRSNMSRLRRWLGDDADGEPYLPDAYSGRIYLAAGITSDWQRMQLLTTGGINRARSSALVAALELVRGAPLADAAPGQWPWAEELRTDMISMVRDIGVELARRSHEAGDLDSARWAANRALVAAPGDELLMTERIRVEFSAGRLDEVDRLVRETQFKARRIGVDLLPETVELMQRVLEGSLRARRV